MIAVQKANARGGVATGTTAIIIVGARDDNRNRVGDNAQILAVTRKALDVIRREGNVYIRHGHTNVAWHRKAPPPWGIVAYPEPVAQHEPGQGGPEQIDQKGKATAQIEREAKVLRAGRHGVPAHCHIRLFRKLVVLIKNNGWHFHDMYVRVGVNEDFRSETKVIAELVNLGSGWKLTRLSVGIKRNYLIFKHYND